MTKINLTSDFKIELLHRWFKLVFLKNRVMSAVKQIHPIKSSSNTELQNTELYPLPVGNLVLSYPSP